MPSVALVAIFAFTLVGPVDVVTSGRAAALVLPQGTLVDVVTLVFASNVHEVETSVALADVTPKGVGALPKSRAGDSSSSAFINIHTGPPIGS